MKYNLLENGLDSLSEAISYYVRAEEEADDRLYKYSILLMSHSVELILKQILEDEHYSLIYKDIDTIGKREETVTIYQALQRINTICKIKLEEYIINSIYKLTKERNKIQHYKVDLQMAEVIKLLNESYAVIKYLLHEILGKNIEDYDNIISTDDIQVLEELDGVLQNLRTLAQNIAKDKGNNYAKFKYYQDKSVKIPCPSCGEKYVLEGSPGSYKCYICYREFDDIDEVFDNDDMEYISAYLKNEIINKRKEKYDLRVFECKNCKEETLFCSEESDIALCLNCFSKYDMIGCENCGEEFPNTDPYLVVGHRLDSEGDFEYETICIKCSNEDKYLETSSI